MGKSSAQAKYRFNVSDVTGAPCPELVGCWGTFKDAMCSCGDGTFHMQNFMNVQRHLPVTSGSGKGSMRISVDDEFLPEALQGKNPDCVATKHKLRCASENELYVSESGGWREIAVKDIIPTGSAERRHLSEDSCQINYIVDSTTDTGTLWQIQWDWVASATYDSPPSYYYYDKASWEMKPKMKNSDPFNAKLRFKEKKFDSGQNDPSYDDFAFGQDGAVMRTEWDCASRPAGGASYVQMIIRSYAWFTSQELEIYFWKGYKIEALQTSSTSTGSISLSVGASFGGGFDLGGGGSSQYKSWSDFCVLTGGFLVCEANGRLESGATQFLLGLSDDITTRSNGYEKSVE